MNKNKLKKIIQREIKNAKCFFEGNSCDFKLIIISDSFRDLSLVNQHKIVLSSLKDHFASGELHALSIETRVK